MKGAALGERELEVMAILWTAGSGTVAEVRDKLSTPLAYTTVLTILRNLQEKRIVVHEAEGRAHRYVPKLAQRTARKAAVDHLVETLFDGSPEKLVAHLIRERGISKKDLMRIRRKSRKKAGGEAKRDKKAPEIDRAPDAEAPAAVLDTAPEPLPVD